MANPRDKKLSSSTAFEVLGGLWLRDRLDRMDHKIDKILMNQAELAQAIADLKADHDAKNAALVDQLNKALAEIIAAIGNQNVTPELQAAFDNLKSAIASGETNASTVSQQLDDLNPDT